MNIPYMIYQAERATTTAEQREMDRRRGELAAALMRPWRRSERRRRSRHGAPGAGRHAGAFAHITCVAAGGPER